MSEKHENKLFTIYTKPGCGPCVGLKAYLKARHVPVKVKDVSVDEVAAAELVDLGYRTAPVTVDNTTGEHWPGLNPERLEAHIAAANVQPALAP